MEHTRWAGRLMNEVAAAKAAIAANYWRLWHSEPPSWGAAASSERGVETSLGRDGRNLGHGERTTSHGR